MDLHHTGVVIRQNRRWQNMSQEDLAKRAKVTIGLIQRVEFGRMTDVHLKKLERILTVLGIPYNKFSLFREDIVSLVDRCRSDPQDRKEGDHE